MVKRAAPGFQTDRKEPAKKSRHEQSHQPDQIKFSSAEDVQKALRNPEIGMLTQVLTSLRNQLTIRFDENPPAPQDERLLLAKTWLEKSPGAQDIFSIMDTSPKPTFNVLSLCLAVLSSLLNLLSSHFIYHALGDSIIKTLLSPSHMRQLNINLNDSSSELILSTLKVLNAMSTFAGGIEKRSVMDGFAWSQKSLQKLFFLRRRGKGVAQSSKFRPDIRTLYIYFILSFLSNTTPTPVKLTLLEQHREVFLLMFKGIHQDAYIVVRRILEICWEGLWNDPKIKRTLKIGLFNETTLNHLLKLYDRAVPEDDNEDHIPADIIHHFMLAILTRPGAGICFRDRGWYPRDNSAEEAASKQNDSDVDGSEKRQGGRIHNRILANVVKGLKVNEDPRQQELVLKILEACPELVTGYWGSANLTLEPRLSSRWITNISILGTIISLPIPTASFILPHSTHLNPSPPPLTSLLANVLPTVLSKNFLTKGLQSTSSLVQHCTALALSKCLSKLDHVMRTLRETALKLGEDDAGQWLQRTQELQIEVEKRIPDFMVIIAMVQQKYTVSATDQNNAKAALLTESALRLLWLYHKLFPRLVAEVKFEVGKLLLTVCDCDSMGGPTNNDNAESFSTNKGQSGVDILRQLHVLHLLNESDQFSWISKFGTSSHSYLHAIFLLYAKIQHEAIRQTTSKLLTHILSSSILFSHDAAELDLWLAALPTTQRATAAMAPDGTKLTDESTAVLAFLDDCIQRCFKTPYRYLEEARVFFSDITESAGGPILAFGRDDPTALPAPLLMTVLEQLRAKITANLLLPSDILAIATFLRKLSCSLTTKMHDFHAFRKINSKLAEILTASTVAPNSLVLRNAIKRESDLLSNILDFLQNPINQTPTSTNSSVQDFLNQIEALSIPSSKVAACTGAYELVDWMRLIQLPLHPSEVKRIFDVVLRFWPPAATEFLYQLDPKLGQLWFTVSEHLETLEESLPYEWAYLHSMAAELTRKRVGDGLLTLFFSQRSWNTLPERRISVGLYRLVASSREAIKTPATLRQAQLDLLSSVMARGRLQLPAVDYKRLKQAIFADSDSIRELFCFHDASNLEVPLLSKFVDVALDPNDEFDSKLANVYCKYWMSKSMDTDEIGSCSSASPWIPFMEPSGVMQYLDNIILSVETNRSLAEADRCTTRVILETLLGFSSRVQVLEQLQARISGLLALHQCLQSHDTLDNLLLLIVERRLPVGCNALPFTLANSGKISNIAKAAQERWNVRSARSFHDLALFSIFLQSKTWNQATVRTMSGIIYSSSEARNTFWEWVTKTEPPEATLLELFLVPLHAYVDILSSAQGNTEVIQMPDSWFSAIVESFFRGHSSDDVLVLCTSCIRLFFHSSSNRASYIACLTTEIQNAHTNVFNPGFIRLLHDLHQLDPEATYPVVNDVVEKALKWMVDIFSGEELSENEVSILNELSFLTDRVDNKAYFVEPIIKTAIQNCLHMPYVIKCVTTLVSSTHLKPLIINRQLQSLVQHSQLYRVAATSLPSREPLVQLLHALFHSHPTNTCQPSHIAPVTRLYGGTLSLSDQLLLSIFYLYEEQRKESVASIFRNWSPSPATLPAQNTLGAILNLDPSRVFRTCTAFPTRRPLDGSVVSNLSNSDDIYDPTFLVLLVVQLLSERKVLTTTDWVQFFRSNVISLVICALTSRIDTFRIVGVATLGGVLHRVEEADFLEKGQVLYILNMLRDLLPAPSTSQLHTRLPTYSTLLLAHALRATFYPSSFLYPVVSRFLLQRPELDATDVPMLYTLLYSSEDGEWSKERGWMIRFLTDSMRDGGRQDWTVLKRRHTWDLIASMWQATRADERPLRKGILEFLANLSSNHHAATSLVLRSSILPWIEIQLENKLGIDTEYIAWLKILENLTTIIDVDKADKVTRGEFTSSVARCLHLICCDIAVSGSTVLIGLLPLVSRVLLRLATRSTGPGRVVDALREATRVMKKMETELTWTNETEMWRSSSPKTWIPQPPHRARGLFDVNDKGCTVQSWAESVLMLWRIIMLPGYHDVTVWNTLICRTLILRVSPWFDSRRESCVEWARKETLSHILQMGTEEAEMEI